MGDVYKKCENCQYNTYLIDEYHCEKCTEAVNKYGIDGIDEFWKPVTVPSSKRIDIPGS